MTAAVQYGANAVYLGLPSCNARQGAKNFSTEEFPLAIQYCHLRGVKVYLTLNTLLSDRELPTAEDLLRLASRAGADGVIVQDWGFTALARSITPDLPLHGSTQMTVHSLDGVLQAAELGLRCVVLSRELSKDDIYHICKHSPIQIEVFAHGALCMCYSGQCAMSALIGSRSGNRGLCAQPCRLPYRLDGGKQGYPLSLKDANLAAHLQELQDMGVSILKLEGRMKRPEYVAVITQIYAALLREKRQPTPEEQEQLKSAFSRDGFTDGYWQGKTGPHMFGTRSQNAPEPTELFQKAKAGYDRENLRTVPITLTSEILADTPCRLTAIDQDGHTVQVQGPVPEPARSRPLGLAEVQARLSKTGGTAFQAERVEVNLEPGLSLPASALNALRRDALEQLTALRTQPPQRREFPAPDFPAGSCAAKEPALTLSLFRGEQLTDALLNLSPVLIYLPVERIGEFSLSRFRGTNVEFCAALPRIYKDNEQEVLLRFLEQAQEGGCSSVSIQNLGQIPLAERLGIPIRGDFGLNVFNSRALFELRRWGLKSAAVSFELRHEQIRDLEKALPCEAIVYGRLPLMITENCLIANQLRCSAGHLAGHCKKPHHLTDRKGEDFPILSVFGCRSELENSKILFLAGKREYHRCGLAYARLRFTTETPEECVRILEAYLGQREYEIASYTRGLFYRGVE